MIEFGIPIAGAVGGLWAYKAEIPEKIKRYKINKNMDPEFKKFQRLLSSDPNSPEGGEVMVRFDSGQEVPFHEHDTVIHDQDHLIEKSASDGTIWYSANKIEAVWIHQESLDDL